MKKLLTIVLSLVMVLSMTAVSFADEAKADQNASFTKTYTKVNGGVSPEETFTFEFTADKVTDVNVDPTTITMPEIPDSTIYYGEDKADGIAKDVAVALSNVAWPSVGVYYYTVNEVAGKTAGVTYDGTTAYLKVTVAYDQGTDTYYTAFVTLSLADDNKDGQTDTKTGGFTNTYSAGSLTVSKEVTGVLGDKTKEFTVKVTFNAPTGKTVGAPIKYIDSDEEKTISIADMADGTETVEITLAHDESVTFTNIPYGVTYTVEENDYTTAAKGEYKPAIYDSNKEGTIGAASVSTEIVNTKDVNIDTGIILDNGLYIVLLAGVAVVAGAFFMKRRQDDYDM